MRGNLLGREVNGHPMVYLDSGNTINNSGTVSGGAPGIFLGASNTINNSGNISGPLGIQTGAGSTVTNSGTITGTSSPAPAVQFLNGGATLILHPTSVLNGGAAASTTITTDALQLGGSGSGSFNVSFIGSSQGYLGFDTFEEGRNFHVDPDGYGGPELDH